MAKRKTIVIENNNEFIAEYLDAYLAMKEIDFAVMISGPWGCGKTHFINQYLSKRRKLLASPDQNLFWYVSLHGVANCAEIDLRLYEAAHPVAGNGNVKLVGHLVRGIVEAGLEIGFQVDTKSVVKAFDASKKLYDKLVKLYDGKKKPSLIVFDDFERSRMDKTVLLGYICDLLQVQVPIVVLGAENEIVVSVDDGKCNNTGKQDKKDVEAYRRIREKVIGKTFYLQDEIRDLFRVLVGDGIYTNAQEWLKCQYVDIVNDLRRGHDDKWQCNYRALKHTFRQLDYILGGLKRHKNVWGNQNFMKTFSRVFVVVGYQVQIGELTEEDFKIDSLFDDDVKNNRLVGFLNEHGYGLSHDNLGQPTLLLPVNELRNIFFGYKSDRNRIGTMIASLPMFSIDKPEDWYLLWQWFQLEDNVAEEIRKKVVKGISEYKYNRAGEIVHIFTIMSALANRKYTDNTVSTLKRQFKHYVAKLDDDGRLLIDEQWQYMAYDGWGGCGYWRIENCKKQPSDDFVEVIVNLAKQREDIKKKAEKEKLFYLFSRQPEALRIALKQDTHPILQDVDAEKFFKEFLTLNNKERAHIRYSFNYRFKQCNNPSTFEQEKKFVNDLVKLMRRWLRKNKECKFGTPSFMIVTEMKENFEKAVTAHEKIQKQRKGELQ